MIPDGYVFLCRRGDRLVLIGLGPMSLTLPRGGVPDRSLMDTFDLAVFPLTE